MPTCLYKTGKGCIYGRTKIKKRVVHLCIAYTAEVFSELTKGIFEQVSTARILTETPRQFMA